MVEVKFPISLPKFTDDEFEQKRAEYVSKHGYYVSPPKLSDIIHLGTPREPDDKEWNTFVDSSLGRSNPNRHREISGLLDKKRAQRDRMLASPTPTWAKNLASVMTVFDDINDTLGTIGVVMRIASKLLPKVLGRLMLGPIGWLFLLADIAGLFLQIMRLPFACVSRKRVYERFRDLNPFSKRARIKRARRVRRHGIGKGEIIELLQTTDNAFGIGLCLGPLLGWGYDILSGIVRTVRGEEVHWGTPPPERPKYIQPCERLLRNAPALHGAGEEMSEDDHLAFMIALNGCTQALKPYIDEWHPLDRVDNFNNVLFDAPRPKHPTTKFILAEVGIEEGQAIGWPGLDKELVGWEELWDHTQSKAATRFMDFAVRNRNNYVGLVGCQNGDEFATNMMLLAEGYETVEHVTEPEWKGHTDFFSSGCVLEKCSGFVVGGRYYLSLKRHAIQFGDQYLIVAGVNRPIGPMGRTWFGRNLHCKHCDIFIGPGFGPAGFQSWIQSAQVMNEDQWFELLRKGIIGLITTGPPR